MRDSEFKPSCDSHKNRNQHIHFTKYKISLQRLKFLSSNCIGELIPLLEIPFMSAKIDTIMTSACLDFYVAGITRELSNRDIKLRSLISLNQ